MSGYVSRSVAGFLEEFTLSTGDDFFIGEFGFVTDESGADFEDSRLHGAAVLLYEDDFFLGGEGKDPDDSGGVRSACKFPVIDFSE